MSDFIREIFAVPFGFVLSLFYNLTDSYIWSIVLLTVLIKVCLLPTSISQQKNSAKQVRLNTKVAKIRAKYEGNQQKIQEETQALYQREGFGAQNMGCGALAIQMIVVIGLYGVVYTPLSSVLQFADKTIEQIKTAMGSALSGVTNPRMIELEILKHVGDYKDKIVGVIGQEDATRLLALKEKFQLFGLDLSVTPDKSHISIYWLIPIFAFLTAMLSSVYMYLRQRKQNPEMAKNPSMGCMTFMSPVMSLVFTFMFPAGVGFYWIISNIFAFVQQIVLTSIYSPKKVIAQQMVDETVYRRSRENNVKKRVEIEKK